MIGESFCRHYRRMRERKWVCTMSYKYNEFKVGQDGELPAAWGMEWTPRRGRKRPFAPKRQQNKMLKLLTLAVGFMAYPYGLGEATEIVPKNPGEQRLFPRIPAMRGKLPIRGMFIAYLRKRRMGHLHITVLTNLT